MKKLIATTLASTMMCMSYASIAADNNTTNTRSTRAQNMDSARMDTNGDNMVSRDEFVTYYSSMYDSMPKNTNGTVDVKGMNTWQRNNARGRNGNLNDSKIIN